MDGGLICRVLEMRGTHQAVFGRWVRVPQRLSGPGTVHTKLPPAGGARQPKNRQHLD